MPQLRISPSAIARYFFHDCERFLRYSMSGREGDPTQGVPARVFDKGTVIESIMEAGERMEARIVAEVVGERAILPPDAKQADGTIDPRRRFRVHQTVEVLKSARPGQFIYQGALRAPDGFYERFAIDRDVVELGVNYPDLIEVLEDPDRPGERLLRVIDLKRSTSAKSTHRVQVLLYVWQLQAILEAEQIDDARVDLDVGGVWLKDAAEPDLVALEHVAPHIERFLRHDLGRIARRQADRAHWHVYFRCEWCDYYGHCREQLASDDNISRIARLSSQAKRFLVDEAEVDTVPELAEFLARDDADDLLARSSLLVGKGPRLRTLAEAYRDRFVLPHLAQSLDLPRSHDVGVYLTLQSEPLEQQTYLAALFVDVGADPQLDSLRAELPAKAQVFVARERAEVTDNAAAFVNALYDVLARLDRHRVESASGYSRGQYRAQVYVYAEIEAKQLIGLLLDTVRSDDAALRARAMTLLIHFHGPDLVLADRHPDALSSMPLCVLQRPLHTLLAIPVDVSLTLPETLERLDPHTTFRRDPRFHFPLGHSIKAKAIYEAWDDICPPEEAARLLRELTGFVSWHLQAVRDLTNHLVTRCHEQLVVDAPWFRLPDTADLANPTLSRLAFLARYESLLDCLAVQAERATPLDELDVTERSVRLQADSATRFVLAAPTVTELEKDPFPSYLLVRDSPQGERAQLRFRDYWYRARFGFGKRDYNPDVAVVSLEAVEHDPLGNATALEVDYRKAFASGAPQPGERYRLYSRYTDFTSDKVVKHVTTLDASGGGFVADLLAEPATVGREPRPLPAEIEATVAAGEDALGLQPSQLEAWRRIREQKAVVVWGPPGTGKTWFLATVVLELARAHAAAGRPFHVLVTAFTHAAINNLLRYIQRRARELEGYPSIAVAKVISGGKQSDDTLHDDPDVLPTIGPSTISWCNKHRLTVLGATVYRTLGFKSAPEFDLVLIDEASQMRVPDATIPISCVSEHGRLVLAGDDLQLPPIVNGAYPEPEPGAPVLHRSIFEALRSRSPVDEGELGPRTRLIDDPLVVPLRENFRMNDVLTSFTEQLVYGCGYRCANEDVARNRLRLLPPDLDTRAFAQHCLDPDFPLVVVMLEGVRAQKESAVEAELVTELTMELYQRLLRRDEDEPYPDSEEGDRRFFREGVFIVCPHRMQNRSVRRRLRTRRDWAEDAFFVDTVDKMQGQQSDCVLVSYGVSDPDFALQEADFIFGLERLNVALSRARSKTVLFLPTALLDVPFQVMESETAALGLAYMRALVDIIERQEHASGFIPQRFSVGSQDGRLVSACVLRASHPIGLRDVSRATQATLSAPVARSRIPEITDSEASSESRDLPLARRTSADTAPERAPSVEVDPKLQLLADIIADVGGVISLDELLREVAADLGYTRLTRARREEVMNLFTQAVREGIVKRSQVT